ncbi:MAG TPA: Gfo/Idh/MocA family oxidoreductase [Candidatus Hydrogenedentes bacterium]|nr:Gfo/Idh/MocA family oxidoreductase [Candidatus Hydrogenedentota bacterium]HQE83284.1 Gfo/Idh/MocA family oxidoreductase [Candidatus Hydrogenedentota bacterium]HQH50800.1 Gfo/Idh/MocA family oxidoreductase [Candidatus Hydrogenedentota bacterium]HQM47738.1 Gfo/Idh/MocA family oxidoreductase [Candidatus Hydrogenedentota bacterium]
MLNVAFIGCGRIADLHFAGYKRLGDARVYAICDNDPARLAGRQAEWGVEKVYTDYRDLLADPEVHAVEVLTPFDTHEEVVLAAARAGKHIACQKPMTDSLPSADRMLAAVKEAGVLFKVTECYVLYPPVAQAKALIDAGVIGEPAGLRMRSISSPGGGWEVPAATYEQQLRQVAHGHGFETFDHGHHEWAMAWHLLGAPERVTAWVDSEDGILDCPATIMWKCKEGTRYGVCDFNHARFLTIPSKYYPNDEWLEVTGSKGILFISKGTGDVHERPPVSVFTGSGWRHYSPPADWIEGFTASTANFVRAIQRREPPLLDAESARQVLRFSLAVERSAAERREVYVEEFEHAFPRWYSWRRKRRERSGCIVGPRKKRLSDLFGGGTRQYAPHARELTLDLGSRYDPSKAAGWSCVVGLRLTAEERVTEQSYALRIKDGGLSVEEGFLPKDAELTLTMPAGTWAAILMGKKRLETALLQGKIKYEGRAEEGLKLRGAFKI